jgi:hypothetical protein
MWKKIKLSDSLLSVFVGDAICQRPNNRPIVDFIIKKIVNGYISAVHSGKKRIMTYFPLAELHTDNWWIRKSLAHATL